MLESNVFDWRTARPNIGMMGQDWTVPERTIEEYDDPKELENAKAYAETYAIPELAAFNIFMTEEDISPDD